jgi:hypothetical protein
MVTGCVLFEVRTEFLNIIYTSFGFKLPFLTINHAFLTFSLHNANPFKYFAMWGSSEVGHWTRMMAVKRSIPYQ